MATTQARRRRRSSLTPTLTLGHLDVIRSGIRSDRGIAEILGVAPSQITRWRQGQTPDPDHADRVAALALIVEMLARALHPEVIEGWLHGPNSHLSDRTPVYMLRNHQLGTVVGAVEAMKAGTFA